MSRSFKTIAAVSLALVVSAGMAEARSRHGGHWHGGGGWGVGAGIAAGALLGGLLAAPYYRDPYYYAPGYYGPLPGDPVAYCMRRFKTYDPRSGTYRGYDGYLHPCP
jgi:hypothetical protein